MNEKIKKAKRLSQNIENELDISEMCRMLVNGGYLVWDINLIEFCNND